MLDLDARLERLQEIYDSLPTIDCKGLCGNSCGPIDMSTAEHDRIINLGVLIPHFSEEASKLWDAQYPLHCPALNRQTGRCDVYEARPLICRVWGVADSMRCEKGCTPTRVMSDLEVFNLVLKSYRIGGHDNFVQDDAHDVAFLELMEDSEVGPLIARFIRGDRTVEAQVKDAFTRRQRSL